MEAGAHRSLFSLLPVLPQGHSKEDLHGTTPTLPALTTIKTTGPGSNQDRACLPLCGQQLVVQDAELLLCLSALAHQGLQHAVPVPRVGLHRHRQVLKTSERGRGGFPDRDIAFAGICPRLSRPGKLPRFAGTGWAGLTLDVTGLLLLPCGKECAIACGLLSGLQGGCSIESNPCQNRRCTGRSKGGKRHAAAVKPSNPGPPNIADAGKMHGQYGVQVWGGVLGKGRTTLGAREQTHRQGQHLLVGSAQLLVGLAVCVRKLVHDQGILGAATRILLRGGLNFSIHTAALKRLLVRFNAAPHSLHCTG